MSQPDGARAALFALSTLASRATGFSREAILPDAMRRVLAAELASGLTEEEVVRRADRDDETLAHALEQAVSVGETFFFRHPEQFELVARHFAGRRYEPGEVVRAWSAGCATGEETHSIAACLRAVVPGNVRVEVLGTDLLERNVAVARAGVYGRWSVRSSGPTLFPVHEPSAPGKVTVLERVRALSTFRAHNLLGEVPGRFDLVLCRNVLVYFAADSGRAVAVRVARALLPGGLALFGPMDLADPPPGLVRAGPAELQAFRRPLPEEQPGRLVRPASAPTIRPAPTPPPPTTPTPPVVVDRPPPRAPEVAEPVALHLKALAMVEQGDDDHAALLLDRLNREAPAYVPALAERALLHERHGATAEAQLLMRRVLSFTATLPPDELVAGPEPLPARFFAASAEAFLESHERR